MKKVSESYTYVFCMLYPWLVLACFMMLHTFGVVEATKVADVVVIVVAGIPVIVAFVWFQIKNK